MIRDLTQEEQSRLLTQEQVDALPTGTRVMIKWTGGNGPWQYTILQQNGMAFVETTPPAYWHLPGCAPTRIDYVGSSQMSTKVFFGN